VGRVVVPLPADVDVVGLDVEDELVLGPLLGERLLVADLLGRDLVAVAEDLVEGEQGRRHAAAGAQEVAPAQALAAGRLGAEGGQAGLELLLLGGLGRRDELFVRGDARRDRRRGFGPGVEVALTDPHGAHPPAGERGAAGRMARTRAGGSAAAREYLTGPGTVSGPAQWWA